MAKSFRLKDVECDYRKAPEWFQKFVDGITNDIPKVAVIEDYEYGIEETTYGYLWTPNGMVYFNVDSTIVNCGDYCDIAENVNGEN